MGVSNQIAIKRSVRAFDVQKKIKAAALGRNAELEADNIVVSTDGGKVTLSGRIDSDDERTLAEDMAWSAPGVTRVDDLVTIN